MSKIYDKTAANFKATTVDAKIIDAQKILVRPKGGAIDERVDICDVLGSSSTSSQDCVALQTLDTYYSEYDTSVFSNGIENVGSVDTSSVRFGSSHFPKGVIKKVSLYGRDANTATHDSKVNGCYLLAKVYKKATGELVRSHSSTNGKVIVLEKQSGSAERPLNTWEFAGFPSISDDEIIKFIPSDDGKTQKAAYYIGCAVDDEHTHLDCQVGGDGDFVNNPLQTGARYLALAKFEGDFYHEVKDEPLKDFEKKFLQSLYTTTNEALFDNNINNEALGVGEVKAFVLERPYITNGTFNDVRWTTTDTINSTTYLKITLRDKHGKSLKSYNSYNYEDFRSPGLKSFRFNEYFDVTDNIGSIVFEACDANGVVSTSSLLRIRVIGNAQKPNADGSEVSNNLYVVNVIFHGKVAHCNDNILSKTTADATYTTKADHNELLTGNVKTTASQQTTVAWDACRVPSEYIMHAPFSTITMTALSDNTNTPVHLGVVAFDGTNRTKLGVSSAAKTWSNGNELIWQFDNDIIVPTNQSIELYLTLSKEAFEQSLDSCGVTITTGAHGSIQSGNYRENNTWYSPRIVVFTMTGVSHFTDSSKHLSKEDKAALQQLAQGSLVSKDELGEVLGALSLSLSLSLEEKAALQQLAQGSLTVKEITIIDDDANAVSLLSENYEEIEDEGIVLKFEDSLDNNYLMCSEKDLVDATDYLELDVNINCPEELGKKLVRRYLVIDLRNMEDERNIVTIFPENIRWSSQIPVIQANNFYVISFQRFAKDLVVANLEINLAE